MKKFLYLDVFSGISGDMFNGALIDLGVDQHHLEHELAKLGLHEYHLHVGRGKKCEIEGVKFDVHCHPHHHEEHTHSHEPHSHPHAHGHSHSHPEEHSHSHEDGHEHSHSHSHEAERADTQAHTHGDDGHHHEPHTHDHHHHEEDRSYANIKSLIERSSLSPWVKAKSLAVFARIGRAEAKIHGVTLDEVHFHEVGGIDSIVDIVSACIGLEALGKPTIHSSTPLDGTGWINCAHGRFPIPAPATLAILGEAGLPLTQCEEPNELITPTGAALLAEFVEQTGPMQGVVARKIGYGLGTRDNRTRPNVLRAILGEQATCTGQTSRPWDTDEVAVLQTNLDDTTPEILGHFVELALQKGALEVFYTAATMKKNRPGVLLSVLCSVEKADDFSELILRETSAFGVRESRSPRKKLQRRWEKVMTPFGEVSIKLGLLGDEVLHRSPEYETCKNLAAQSGTPICIIYEAARQAAREIAKP